MTLKSPVNQQTDPIGQLAWFFRGNGYVRERNEDRFEAEGYQSYKKGSEVRLTANSRLELTSIRRLLKQAGFKPGRPFTKGRQYRLPVYGKEAVRRFLSLVRRKGNV